MDNYTISKILETTADFLEIKGDNPYRIRAYRTAAQSIEDTPQDIEKLILAGSDLSDIHGIGKDLAEKIKHIIQTGTLPILEDLKKELNIDIESLLKIHGLGAKRIKILYDNLNIHNVDELKAAAMQNKISGLPGLGEKTQTNILTEIKNLERHHGRFLYINAEELANKISSYLKLNDIIKKISLAGSFRRGKDTIGDLDILITTTSPKIAAEYFLKYEDISSVLSHGEKKVSVILKSQIQVDMRIVDENSYGAAMQYFTGSKEHNIAVRKIAVKKNLLLNEYGLFAGEKNIASKTEEEIYNALDLKYIPPELRENRGEIEINTLPNLITQKDIRGDLHMHTNYSDGKNSIEEMVVAAKNIGYEYIGITDHSKRLTIANGLDEKRLMQQIEYITNLQQDEKNITILKGIEVDILEDGSLDLADEVLKELDFVIASIHSKFSLSKDQQTTRIIKAMDNPYCKIIGHPTGRLLLEREGYNIDIEKIIFAAKERNKILELNGNPRRLDLNDIHLKMAKEMQVKIIINTDSHNITNLAFMKYGITQARRGWIEKQDVINTLPVKKFKQLVCE